MDDVKRMLNPKVKRFLFLGLITGLLAPLSSLSISAYARRDAPTASNLITRVSVGSNGAQADNYSWAPALSANGQVIAFVSAADNLVPGDTNAVEDIFIYDRHTGQVERISVAPGGAQGNASSLLPAISADGSTVAFLSAADNLVQKDTNAAADIFLHDRRTAAISRISTDSDGREANAGAFDTPPALSADGRVVAFCSYASNLVAEEDFNGALNPDVYVHDRASGETSRVSVASNGVQGDDGSCKPSISADGRYVAFESAASNLVPGDTNGNLDIFVHDRQTAQTEIISRADGEGPAGGISQNPSISANGRKIAFVSSAADLVPGDANGRQDIFVFDRITKKTVLASVASVGAQGDGDSPHAVISGDGRFVLFASLAATLVAGDNNEKMDLFTHRLGARATLRVSASADGKEGDGSSRDPAISADGCTVAFASNASNLVPQDTNGVQDFFVRQMECGWEAYLPWLND